MEALKKVCKKTITEIVEETVEGDKYFVCHKTLDLPSLEQKLCAGKLILEGKINRNGNSSTRIGRALGLIPKNYSEIQGSELVFESKDECINHHSFVQ